MPPWRRGGSTNLNRHPGSDAVRRRGGHRARKQSLPAGPVLLCALLAWAPVLAQGESDEKQQAGGLAQFAQRDSTQRQEDFAEAQDTQFQVPLLVLFENTPKAGLSASVREVKTYSEWYSKLALRGSQVFQNTLDWSWSDFRQQEKTSQTRGSAFSYTSGTALPVTTSLTSKWDWSRDETLNNAGLTNIASRDFKMAELNLSRGGYRLAGVDNKLEALLGMKDQKAESQGLPNNFSEASLGGRLVSKADVAEGLSVSTRVYGQTVGGDRSLGDLTSPSSTVTDSLGVRVGFHRRFAKGFIEVTRGRIEEEFLDFNRNNLGFIDTATVDEADKIVEEMKTQNATALNFDNYTALGSFSLRTIASHMTGDLSYQASGLGRTERIEDKFTTTLGRTSSRDSMSVTYDYGWKWDDQRTRASTANRGRQYNKDRGLDFYWMFRAFEATELILKIQNSLSQSIAENQFNQNDRDRVRQDVTFEIGRTWSNNFVADMLFAYKMSEDISIRSTRSSNNTVKDSYEISPGYNWPVAGWLTVNQTFRLYIQYTDYVFSDLESVNKNDDYNKRGNLGTRVTLTPWERLKFVVKHDYNKRYNATRVRTDVTGNSYYSTDDKQTTSRIDLSAQFDIAEGISIEGATYDRLDEKETMGTNGTITENRAGQVWTGLKFVRKYGSTASPLDVSCLIKKYSAYGPAVTATTADYWEADVWVKWKF